MDEYLNIIATTINAAPRMRYGVFKLSILAVDFTPSAIVPKIAKLIIKGPIVVPTLFIPPAKLSLCDPFSGSPITIAKGLAAVCCKENPSPTIN